METNGWHKVIIEGRAYLAKSADKGWRIVTKRGKAFKLFPLFDHKARPIYADKPGTSWRNAQPMPSAEPRVIRPRTFEPSPAQLRAAYDRETAARRTRKPGYTPPPFRDWFSTDRKRDVLLALFDASDPAPFKLADNFGFTNPSERKATSRAFLNVADKLLSVRYEVIYDDGSIVYLENFISDSFVASPAPPIPAAAEQRIVTNLQAKQSNELEQITARLTHLEQSVTQKHAKPTESPTPDKLTVTQAVMWTILNQLAVHDAKMSARPTLSEYFRAYMMDKLTTKAMKQRGWKERTMRNRRQLAEKVITETYGRKINLRKFRDTIDPRIFRAAEEQLEAARARGRKACL